VEVQPLLDELRIVIDSSLRDGGISSHWEIEDGLPAVWADRQSLMQVFLNLTKNSERAMEETEQKSLTVSARREASGVAIRFRDTGCGVAHPERLFHPFQEEAQSTGLGLYLSRAFMRSFKGDLHYEPETGGSTFVVELSSAARESKNDSYEQRNSDIADRRPQPVPGEPQPAASD
jgi:two-component system, LuxR family, sensor kinase FixL